MPEIDWEFAEGPDNDGQFMATGKVITLLRSHLIRGEIDAAVSLYESCVENVGDQVWQEFRIASAAMKKAIAHLFFRSRDYMRSAAACEHLGEWIAAGRSYEAAYDLQRAAACYLKVNDCEQAARVLEKSGDYRRAAELYQEAQNMPAAAAALEKAGDLIGAAQLFVHQSDFRRAAQLLSQIPQNDPRFLQAVGILSDVFVRLNRRDLAVRQLALAVPRGARIQDPLQADLAYRLGRLMWEAGHGEQARQAFDLVRVYDPSYRDVARCLEALSSGVKRSAPISSPFHPVMPSPGVSASGPVHPASTVPNARLAGGAVEREGGSPVPAQATDPLFAPASDPLSTKPNAPARPISSPPRPADTVPHGFVMRMEGYQALKKLPIFEDLSLDEMKAFYTICDQVYYAANDVIIEEGRRGEALFIVTEGALRVSKTEGGREITLAMLPAGNYVGEMSLIDDAPTSARVTAAEPVKALRIHRDRFEPFLFANDRIALRVYRRFLRTISARLRESNALMTAMSP